MLDEPAPTRTFPVSETIHSLGEAPFAPFDHRVQRDLHPLSNDRVPRTDAEGVALLRNPPFVLPMFTLLRLDGVRLVFLHGVDQGAVTMSPVGVRVARIPEIAAVIFVTSQALAHRFTDQVEPIEIPTSERDR